METNVTNFSSIIGQPLAVDLCRRWLSQGSNHPLLFYGPEGVGKRTLALEVAKALHCDAKDDERKPCNSCLHCKKITSGIHPDVRTIDLAYQAQERREAVEKQQSLRIE